MKICLLKADEKFDQLESVVTVAPNFEKIIK